MATSAAPAENDAPAAYVIAAGDTVATALDVLPIGHAVLRGARGGRIDVHEEIPRGHKIALTAHEPGDHIVKYGIVTARATKSIAPGTWVHLHCAESRFDERSAALDPVTGAPTDTSYA